MDAAAGPLMAVTELLPLEGLTVSVLHTKLQVAVSKASVTSTLRHYEPRPMELEPGTSFPGWKALLKTLL